MTTRIAAIALASFTAAGCVTSGTHEAVVNELQKTRSELDTTRASLTTERDDLATKSKDCDEKLTGALDQNQQLVTKVSSMGQNVEQLLGEKDKMGLERERLATERKELAKEVDELKRMRAAAETRNNEYKKVFEKLRKMMDAGTLDVKVRNGRMVVRMSSDVVFSPGSASIKTEAGDAIRQVADTIKQFADRKFMVIGHSDATPIKTERFPSNWELSSQRAIEVVRLMVEAGVPPEMLSAAGQAEFDPLAKNDSSANKNLNRRVEIVFMPKIDELPGFDDLGKK
jgi:chemotaxis protein MotB